VPASGWPRRLGTRFVIPGDRNGMLYDTDGQVVSEHVLGDGIGHVLATSTGQVWIGPDHDRFT
jgi:hypothetical protein